MSEEKKLSTRQQNLLEYMLANPSLREYTCARNCGIPSSTYQRWKASGEFTKELNRRLEEQWEEGRRLAIEQMQELARQGNFNANKYILDSLGYAAAKKIQADVSTDNAININLNIVE